ncbi:hypothetical protein [Longimicrobium sp.]|uniref:hypothetical protein n=1 Tax=Longimicrobium sp. TaxID=2029185 RepID=UPI003B3B1F56
MPEVIAGGPKGRRIAVVEAFGFLVSVVRWPGERRLRLEAVMKGSTGPVFQADAGTTDVAGAEANAKGFAAGLSVELAPPGASGPALVRPTYGQLEDEIRRRGKDVDGLLSRLRLFMRTFGLDEQGRVGPELGAELPKYQKEFRAELMRQGKSPATIGPYLSKVNKLAEIAASVTVVEGSGLTFGETLRVAMERRGIPATTLARTAAITNSTLHGWITGQFTPDRENREALPVLERELGLPDGTLAKLVGALRPMPPRKTRAGAMPFALALRKALQAQNVSAAEIARRVGMPSPTLQGWVEARYVPGEKRRESTLPVLEKTLQLAPGDLSKLLPEPTPRPEQYAWALTHDQQKEWETLKAHKTNRTPANRSTRAGSFWRVYEDGESPTADFVYTDIRHFFGYLTLPPDASDPRLRGLGRDGSQLSILDLAVPEQVQGFIDFRARRASSYNTATISFLAWLRALLRPKTGFFWQANGVAWESFSPQSLLLADGERPQGTLQQWRSHCERMVEWIGEWLEDLSDSITHTRDYQHIQAILDLDRPMDALRILLDRMTADYENTADYLSPLRRALRVRDLLYVSMLVRNPLRKKHWSQMTWRADNTGQLRKRAGGDYQIFIPRRYFKSLAEFRDEDYLADVDPALTPLIDDYLAACRPLLLGAEGCDWVFRPGPVGSRRVNTEPFTYGSWLSSIVVRYIPEYAPRGFNPHAVRHIVATHLVRTRPDGIDRAADALHNTRSMIKKTYGHLRGRDLTAKAQRIIWEEIDP